MKQLSKIFRKMASLRFSLKLDHLSWMITNLIAFPIFLAILRNSQFGKKQVKFELHVSYSFLFIFFKNHL